MEKNLSPAETTAPGRIPQNAASRWTSPRQVDASQCRRPRGKRGLATPISMPMSPELHAHAEAWSCPLLLTSVLALVGLAYLRGWFRLRNNSRNTISAWRVTAFLSGMFFSGSS